MWLRVASELRQSGFQLIALSTQDAELEMNDDTFFVKVADTATLGFLEDKNNRDAINKAFMPWIRLIGWLSKQSIVSTKTRLCPLSKRCLAICWK